ncbi:MAG: NAD(P)/FAD-dependent oxidoreductase [Rudaea sp.]
MSKIADVVIVGSGAIGCSIAFALADSGIRRIVVVDRGPLVSGMTRRSAGLAHTFEGDRASMALARSSLQTFREWSSTVGGSCAYNECGTLVLAETEEEEAILRERCEQQANLRIRVRLLEPSELAANFPAIRFRGARLAAWEPDSGYLDPVLASQTLAQRARDKGATFETGSHVRRIEQERGRIKAISTTTGSIETPALIIAAGTGAERLLAPLGISLNLALRRGVVGFYEQSPSMRGGHPSLVQADGAGFIRSHSFHLSAVGIVDSQHPFRSSDSLDENVSLQETQAMSRLASERFPDLENAPVKRSHAILYDRVADGRPALGPVPGFEGLYVAAGFGASAAAVAPAVGRALAETIRDSAPRQDLSELSLSRPGLRTGGRA